MRYLVTDDSKLARMTLIKSLTKFVDNSQIMQATNGNEAIDIVDKYKPDIVFLDLTMPEMDGYEAIPKILKSNPKTKIVVVSADIQTKAKEMAISLGAKLHVQKPINSQTMQEILELLE
ncbi:MAG: response regulator [Sulfurimonas sp.]|nr:response regulator [Sulfurimonas sp.]